MFSLPGCEAPAQQISVKSPEESKLDSFFLYLCKGPDGRKLPDAVFEETGPGSFWKQWIILDLMGRPVKHLHEKFHENAAEIRAGRSSRKGPGEWYEKLAAECRAARAITRDDVMQIVSKWYVYESKKGFDKFAVTRTFWAVFALVNGIDCHALLLEQCLAMVHA